MNASPICLTTRPSCAAVVRRTARPKRERTSAAVDEFQQTGAQARRGLHQLPTGQPFGTEALVHVIVEDPVLRLGQALRVVGEHPQQLQQHRQRQSEIQRLLRVPQRFDVVDRDRRTGRDPARAGDLLRDLGSERPVIAHGATLRARPLVLQEPRPLL